jgi:hypothetical protein
MLISHNAGLGHQGGTIEFVAINHGRSPARVLRAEINHFTPDFDNPPNVLGYLDEHFTYKHQEWIVVGEKISVGRFSLSILRDADNPLWEDITYKRKRLWLCGIVRYADGLTKDIHTSKFCYQYVSGEISGLIMDGPDGANECT